MVNEVIRKKMAKRSGEVSDAIDALLKDVASHSSGASGGGGGKAGEEEGEERMSPDFLSENIVEMMIPGEDSVPILMTLAIKYLSDCPAALQQLRVSLFLSLLSLSLFTFDIRRPHVNSGH